MLLELNYVSVVALSGRASDDCSMLEAGFQQKWESLKRLALSRRKYFNVKDNAQVVRERGAGCLHLIPKVQSCALERSQQGDLAMSAQRTPAPYTLPISSQILK